MIVIHLRTHAVETSGLLLTLPVFCSPPWTIMCEDTCTVHSNQCKTHDCHVLLK